jgi:hypothetical protein
METKLPFQWERQPLAEKLILDILQKAIDSNPSIAKLSSNLLAQTNTRLFDWLDHLIVPESEEIKKKLIDTGFENQQGEEKLFYHPGAQLPRVLLSNNSGIAILVDSIADFLMVRGEYRPIEGSRFGNFRKALFSSEHNVEFWVIERRGTLSLQPTFEKELAIFDYYDALEQWMTRSRPLKEEDHAMDQTIELVQNMIRKIGQHRAAWTVLEGERRYWQARNTAGQIQKNRQDSLGMGWANHDHHTFRSSRRRFNRLIHLFELLGFHCRERFYAGEEAGWGAQVMEDPVCRLVLFLDVDLAPGEIAIDFAHEPLSECDHLGTVGLWCALHGDSILKGGMHHLEAQFMFDELKEGLGKKGVKMMEPFSSFDHLKQAFTAGETWYVEPSRIKELIHDEKITKEQGDHFLYHGAIGSHLENL